MSAAVVEKKSVQTFGKKKTATAVAFCKEGKGHIKVNGCPLALVEPEILRQKVFEPVRLLGEDRFKMVDIHIRVKGGGYVSQIYAIRQVSRGRSEVAWCSCALPGNLQGDCGVLSKVRG